MAGVTVYLDANNNRALDAGEPSTLTAADGSYAFAGLRGGDYVVREVIPADFRQTTPGTSPDRLFAVNTLRCPNQILETRPADRRAAERLRAPRVGLTTGNAGLDFDGTTLYFLSDSNDVLYRHQPRHRGRRSASDTCPPGSTTGWRRSTARSTPSRRATTASWSSSPPPGSSSAPSTCVRPTPASRSAAASAPSPAPTPSSPPRPPTRCCCSTRRRARPPRPSS